MNRNFVFVRDSISRITISAFPFRHRERGYIIKIVAVKIRIAIGHKIWLGI